MIFWKQPPHQSKHVDRPGESILVPDCRSWTSRRQLLATFRPPSLMVVPGVRYCEGPKLRMDAQVIDTAEPVPGSRAFDPDTRLPAPPHEISDNDFEEVVRGALEAVGGTLLFKMKVGADGEGHHAAAAAVGVGEGRQFLLLTLPTQAASSRSKRVAQQQPAGAHRRSPMPA